MNNNKNLLSIGLLIFVTAAVVTAVIKQSRTEIREDVAQASQAEAALPASAVVATFFHGETRCPTCRKIEDYAQQAIKEGFADKLALGEIQWRVVNYDAPANKHYTTDYEIYSSTVVLVRTIDGKPADWRNLERVWGFVNDEEAFKKYVRTETQEMLSL